MSLVEGYIAKWREYPEDEVKIRVARPSVLGPSKELLEDYKSGRVDWEGYEKIFRAEILANSKAMKKIAEIRGLLADEDKTVRLMCYEKNPPCHRFILINMINDVSIG